ncbi:hypothetical protein VTJ49DRAFT_552 [Mycothermus thermophilus]|uniref:PH domain-containing protein n=1 Tax=Humicola insolens TaxID=85995 RepID=A0ABR3VEQ8_HUMIN
MTSSFDEPTATVVGGDAFDPFMASPSGPPHLRHSNFDTNLLALGPGTSVEQVKRAIEAHLRDTERRMEEAGKLGTALVQQQKQLTEKLREVEQLQSETELTPELRQRLVEIEKDYNEVARESARALLPKQRVPSNEAPGSSPFSPDKHVARRSVSPSKFETLAAPSPTKFSVSNRKVRNQPASRIHDIEFAAEISTSLIAQVRNLQALLSEREEELKEVKAERSQLEVEVEAFQQRLKTLDESENRYKDENWNLETQIHELIAAQKAGAEREKKLTQALTVIQAERTAVQRELEEVKDSLAKQDEKHSAEIKNLEIELGTSRRTAATFEAERATLQKRVEELTGQNQELAKAFSALQRGRALEREAPAGSSGEDSHSAPDHNTPEHSPPPSPMKPAPRHPALESETLKTSLSHAQRTIQTLRTNIHREKTEKLELKRMLQEARDEIEKLRSDPNPAPRRSRKSDYRESKKPAFKVTQLGIPRSSRIEVVEDDDWEDQSEIASPRVLSRRNSTVHRSSGFASAAAAVRASHFESSNEQFETANETSDAAFETANERGTETEDFQTGVEDVTDDNSATETETGPSRGLNSIKRPPPLPPHHASNHYAFDSTASTSSEDDEYSDIKTPSGPRMRMRGSRGSMGRRSRQFSEEPSAPSSPSSVSAHASTTPGGQSLFAELNQFDNSDEDSCPGAATPSRRSVRSFTPATPATPRSVPRGRASPVPDVPALPRIMVDCGTMTDPVYIRPVSADGTMEKEFSDADDVSIIRRSDILKRPGSMESVITAARGHQHPAAHWLGGELREGGDASSRRSSFVSYSDASVQHDWDMSSNLALFPEPPRNFTVSSVQGLDIEPIAEPEQPVPPLGVSSILSEQTEPVAEVVEPPTLSLAAVVSEHVEPVVLPEPEPPVLGMPALVSQTIEPVELEIPKPEPPTVSTPVVVSDIEPVEPAPAPLTFSSVQAEEVEPVKIETEPVVLSTSAVLVQQVEPVEIEIPAPVAEARSLPAVVPVPVPAPEPLSLSLSDIASEQVEPRELEPKSPVKLAMSAIAAEHVEPLAEEPAPPAQLSISTIAATQVEPVVEEPPTPVKLSISTIAAEQVEPQVEEPTSPLKLSVSIIAAEHVEPQAEEPATPVKLSISTIAAEEVQPVQEPPTPAPTLVMSPIKTLDAAPQEPRETSRSGVTVIHVTEPGIMPKINPNPKALPKEMEPVEPRSPKRNAFIIPRDLEGSEDQDATAASGEKTPARQPGKVVTVDQGAQTTLTSDAIDQMLREKLQPPAPTILSRSHSFSTVSTPATVRIHRPRQESFDTPLRHKGLGIDTGSDPLEGTSSVRRPGSSASGMESINEVPPLPANHKEVIEAARSGSANGGQGTIGNMGPPLMPASAMRAQNPSLRPLTPTGSRYPATLSAPVSGRITPTHRAAGKQNYMAGFADVHDAQSVSRATLPSRKSSISSFTSEVDNRFNMHGTSAFDPQGFGPNTDPRMIQAITQTMIGEYLWKYTRKAGRGDTMSEKRHRRYFWVHPYTRTLYWSDRDPSTAGRHELKAKSVQIERVHVVADDNPMPPGLHRKSLVVVSPGRSIKFTCTTGQRHETWFNALSYLLLRTASDGQSDAEEIAGNVITREDVDEFNPGYGARAANGNRPPAPPSVSSYTSQSVRNSPTMDMASFSVPTLTPSRSRASQAQKFGTLSRISGYLRDNKVSGTFASMRSRSVQGRHTSLGIYEAHDSEVQDSAEDLREMIERQDREADRLENVRACCDGKHDVGTLSNSAKKSRHSVAGFRSPTPSGTPTPIGTVRSRV